jgi:hypothetical protein
MNLLLCCDFWTIISSIGCFLSGVFTILLFWVGYRQIRKYIGLGEIDLYYKLKNDFSTPQSMKLIKCIETDSIWVRKDETGFPFMVEEHIEEIGDGQDHLLSDDLLGHIEDMNIFYQKKLITLETIIEGYGRYIILCYRNQSIQEYIELKREFYKLPSLHNGLKKLYDETK